ncbi:unnamed protein product [[Candida] boidinii]|nr:unnamed protein product [[Candida] boidinii]
MNSHINRQISGENNNDRKHLNINGYKEEKIIRYKYNFNDWKSNSKNYLFTGNISLFEVQDMNKFSFNNNANDNDNNINNNNDDDDDGIKCKLNINTNEGLKWGVSWYDEINYIDTKNPLKKPIKIKPFKQNGYMHTVQRIAPQYYTVVLTYKPENTDNSNTNDNIDDVKKICIGMVLNNIYDDMRLDSNLKEFNQRCEKLKIFRKNYSDDLNKSGSLIDDDTNTSNNVKLDRKNNDSNDYDIESEDDSLHNVQLNSSTINNKDSIIIETENFDIEEEEDDDNDDFGDFVSS